MSLGSIIVEKLCGVEVGTVALSSICDEITKDIVTKNQTLLELIEQLESFLTHTDLGKRILGLSVVAHVIQPLPRDLLSTLELEYLVQFFCSQVNNHHSLISAALLGLNELVQFPALSSSSLHHATTTLFNSVTWQTQVQGDRRNFYNILHFIIFNRLEDYKTTSSETLFNVISAVDGERDPRNLLILFSFFPKLFCSLPLGSLVEDAFEVASCYFPIDFHQSSTEPGSVTKEDLVSALIPCLLAVSDFAIFCIALIQEKLQSTLKSAKIDSYYLLIAGCDVWPSHVLGDHSEALWVDIKRDTLPPRDAHVAELASNALQALVKNVPEQRLPDLLASVIRSCEIFLSDVQLSLFEPASCLLLSLMEACIPACHIVAARLLPGFLALLRVTKGASQVLILRKLAKFTQICLKQKIGFKAAGDWAALWAEVITCVEADTETCQTGYEALRGVTSELNSELRFRLYPPILMQIVDSLNHSARSAAIKCLQELALIHEEEVQLNIIEKMFVNEDAKDELTKDINRLEGIFSVAAVAQRFHQVMEVYITRIISKGSSHVTKVIALLRDLMEDGQISSNTTFTYFIFCQSTIIPTLITLDTDELDLTNSAKIIQILVRMQSPSEQIKAVQRLGRDIQHNENITHKMVLLEALLGPLWPEAVVLTVQDVINNIVPVAIDSTANPLARTSALRLIACYVNKAGDDRLLEAVSEQVALSAPVIAAEAHAYITTALVLRGHPLADRWIDKLVGMLDETEDVAQMAAEGFKQIMEKSPQYLNNDNHCRVRLLYRQRLFQSVVPRLVNSTQRVHHLKALASLLQTVPDTVYSPYIKQMIPLLVKSLDSDFDLLLTTLRTLADLLLCSSTLLEEYVDVFVRRLLPISKENKSMDIRIAALKCLCNTLKFSPVLLMPYKTQVLFGLVHCLDDKKRLVRREAARCRSRWFLLGSPSTDS